MKVATWNVNGIRARQAQFLEWIERDRPDVLCLQEIKATPAQLSEALSSLPEYWSYWHGGPGGYSGVSLHLRKSTFPEEPAFSHPPFDQETRIVEARVGRRVYASVYVPNGGKDYDAKMVFLRALAEDVKTLVRDHESVVLCGDMNVARTDLDVHPSQVEAGVIGQRPEERDLIEAIVTAGLVDVGRSLDPENKRLFTWWPNWKNARTRNLGWRIDYVLATPSLKASSCTILKEVGTSDHAPVLAAFSQGVGEI